MSVIFNITSTYLNFKSGNPSYLSHDICNEFIESMAERVSKLIIGELKLAKYYSISVDSTPDLSHVDQLTFIVRYVKPTGMTRRRTSFI